MNNQWVEKAVLVAAAAAFAQTGCGEDAEPVVIPPEAGSEAAAGSGGAGGSGGSGGTSGASGAAGSGGSAVDSGLDASAPETGARDAMKPDGGASDAGPDGADAGTLEGLLLAVSTDYFAETELAAVDLATGSVTSNVTVQDGDAVVRASGGYGFLVERTNNKLHVLSETGAVDRTIELAAGDAAVGSLNPRDVVVHSGDGGSVRAFVSMYAANRVNVFDLESGDPVAEIDLAGLLDGGDSDGSVEVDAGIYLPGTGLVYFTVQRIDLNSATMETGFRVQCPAVPSLLIAIDPSDNTLVDLNGGDPGEALALDLVGPADLDYEAATGKLYVLSNGCVTAPEAGAEFARERHGIEVFDPQALTTTVAFAPSDQKFYASLFLLDESKGIVQSYDDLGSSFFNGWEFDSDVLGDTLAGVPAAPVVLSPSTLVGLSIEAADGGVVGSVIRYDVAVESGSSIVSDIWEGELGFVGGAEVVR